MILTEFEPNPIRAVQTPRFFKQWMIAKDPSNFINELIEKFGNFVHYRGIFDFFLVNDPALIRQVLRETHRKFDKNTVIYNRFRNALGNSLVNAEGDHWRKQRKLMQPVFGSDSVQSFFHKMTESSHALVDRWNRKAEESECFDVASEMNQLTLEIAGKSLFSEGFHNAAADIRRWTRVINCYSAKPPIPILGHPSFPSSVNRNLKKVLREYRIFIYNMIQRRLDGETSQDLLSVFLTMEDEETGEKMAISEIAEEVLGMIIGGHETSSTALTWTLHELDRHPTVEAQVVAELERVTNGNHLQFSQIKELEYTKAVVEESMRLHPPLWFENRNAMEDVNLGDSTIPKGSMVALSRYALHRNPLLWDRPDQFDPSRFLSNGSEEKKNPRTNGSYIPFSSGPRACIGRRFAMMEIMVILTTILQRFKVRVSPKNTFKVATNLTMELRDGLFIELSSRD